MGTTTRNVNIGDRVTIIETNPTIPAWARDGIVCRNLGNVLHVKCSAPGKRAVIEVTGQMIAPIR